MTAASTNNRSDRILQDLLALHPKKIDLSLDRIERLLAALDHPERKLPPVIHISGTNGKGSVAAITRASLEAAGHRVHVYTSPHLVRFHERIRLAGTVIGEQALSDYLAECEDANKGEPITFFEITTAAALLAFSRTEADACILETGLGGRLDATNVVDQPLMTAITPIHFDHQSFLGRTLAEISREKAGIIKENIPVVAGPQPTAVSDVLIEVAEEKNAPLHLYGRDWEIEVLPGDTEFVFRDPGIEIVLPRPKLQGAHQITNAGQAVKILRCQAELKVPDAAFRAGLDWARWPARLQRIDEGDLGKELPDGCELWLDGGHNIMAGRALKAYFSDLETDAHPLYLICGMMGGKDAPGFLKNFSGLAEAVYAVPIPGEDGAMPAPDLAAAATSAGLSGRLSKDIPSAISAVLADARRGQSPVILITGSLYLAGDALKRSGLLTSDF